MYETEKTTCTHYKREPRSGKKNPLFPLKKIVQYILNRNRSSFPVGLFPLSPSWQRFSAPRYAGRQIYDKLLLLPSEPLLLVPSWHSSPIPLIQTDEIINSIITSKNEDDQFLLFFNSI